MSLSKLATQSMRLIPTTFKRCFLRPKDFGLRPFHVCTIRQKNDKPESIKDDSSREIDVQRERPYQHLTFGQRVVQAGTDLTYLLVIITGIGFLVLLVYLLGSEMISKSGPTTVYNAAVKRCMNSPEVADALGLPITANYGRTGRPFYIRNIEFVTKEGEHHTRIKFHLKGAFRKADVHAETFINKAGNREFEYLIVECDGYPPKVIHLEKRETRPSNETITFF